MSAVRNILLMFLLPAVVFTGGCDGGYGGDASHPMLRKAQRCREEGEYEAALGQLHKFLSRRPDSPKGLLQIASIYDENMDKPLVAAYYYSEYLRVAGNSPEAATVREFLSNAEKRFAARYAERTGAETDKVLQNRISELEKINNRLTLEIAALRVERGAAPPPSGADGRVEVAAAAETPASPAEKTRYHAVKAGESLSTIARLYYGAASRFEVIARANGIDGKTRLKIGQLLKIPPENPGESSSGREGR